MKYVVRMEFDIESIDFGDVEVEANSKEEAKRLAISKYLNSAVEVDYYSSSYYDSTLRSDSTEDWLVTEKD